METFLNDYGLVWVGSSGSPEATVLANFDIEVRHEFARPWRSPQFDHHFFPHRALQKDFHVLEGRIRELNRRAGEGVKKVVRTAKGAQLKEADHVPFTVYRDGFLLWRGPFRSWEDPATQEFIRVSRPLAHTARMHPHNPPFYSLSSTVSFSHHRTFWTGTSRTS